MGAGQREVSSTSVGTAPPGPGQHQLIASADGQGWMLLMKSLMEALLGHDPESSVATRAEKKGSTSVTRASGAHLLVCPGQGAHRPVDKEDHAAGPLCSSEVGLSSEDPCLQLRTVGRTAQPGPAEA